MEPKPHRPMLDPVISRGQILIYRVFDIAEEVDLSKVDSILRADSNKTRLKLASSGRQALVMRNPPLRIGLGDTDIEIGTQSFKAEVYATIWDYGVVSILIQIPIKKGAHWSDLVSLSEIINGDFKDSEKINGFARRKSQELAQLLGAALKQPCERNLYEDYVIYYFEEIDGFEKPIDLLTQADVPALILGEPREVISEKNAKGILENSFQYAETDLAVVDWNSAIVVERTGSKDITDVLEFALTHLLEFRYYDDLLDKRLSELYDSIEARRARILMSHFASISREANARFIEFSEFIERVDNSLKVVGDFYLAVIFRGAIRRFRIPDWQQSVTRKMNVLARVSELLQGEVNVYRGHTLEIIIILLILFEIVSTIVNL